MILSVSFPVYFYREPLKLQPHFVIKAAACALGLYLALFRRSRSAVPDPNVRPFKFSKLGRMK